MRVSALCAYRLIGASLSEPHTSVTALQDACVCLLAAIYRKFKLNEYEDIRRYTYISNLHTCFKIQIFDRRRAMLGYCQSAALATVAETAQVEYPRYSTYGSADRPSMADCSQTVQNYTSRVGDRFR